MRRISVLMVALGIFAVAAMAMRATAQEGPPATQGAGPGGPKDGPPKGPPAFHILPCGAAEKLNLTADQKTQIAALEKDTKAKLDAILTPEQQKIVSEMHPPRPRGQGGPGGGRRGQGGPGGGGEQDGPPTGGQGGSAGSPPPQE